MPSDILVKAAHFLTNVGDKFKVILPALELGYAMGKGRRTEAAFFLQRIK